MQGLHGDMDIASSCIQSLFLSLNSVYSCYSAVCPVLYIFLEEGQIGPDTLLFLWEQEVLTGAQRHSQDVYFDELNGAARRIQ